MAGAVVPRAEKLLDEMADHRARFEAFCRTLSPEELGTRVPDSPWTVRDYIAHLSTIETLINPWFGAMAGVTGVPAPDVPPPAPFDLDEWNEAVVANRDGRPLDDIFQEAAENRRRYSEIVSRMTDQHLDTKVPFGGDRKAVDLPPVMVTMVGLLTGITLHDPMHMQDILRALPQRRQDAAGWLDQVDMSRMDPEMVARRV